MIAILHLNLRREFFAQIAAGTKRIEYRGQTPYWKRRLDGRHYDAIQFRNGYATEAPEMLVEFRGLIRTTLQHHEIAIKDMAANHGNAPHAHDKRVPGRDEANIAERGT